MLGNEARQRRFDLPNGTRRRVHCCRVSQAHFSAIARNVRVAIPPQHVPSHCSQVAKGTCSMAVSGASPARECTCTSCDQPLQSRAGVDAQPEAPRPTFVHGHRQCASHATGDRTSVALGGMLRWCATTPGRSRPRSSSRARGCGTRHVRPFVNDTSTRRSKPHRAALSCRTLSAAWRSWSATSRRTCWRARFAGSACWSRIAMQIGEEAGIRCALA